MLCFFPREDYEWLAEALEEADGSGGIGGDYPDLGVGVQVRHKASLFLHPHCCAAEFPLFILISPKIPLHLHVEFLSFIFSPNKDCCKFFSRAAFLMNHRTTLFGMKW